MDDETKLKMAFQLWRNEVVWAAMQGAQPPPPPPHLAPHVARFLEVERLHVQARSAAEPAKSPEQAAAEVAALVEAMRKGFRSPPKRPSLRLV